MKKCLCFFLAGVMLLLLGACRKKPAENTDNTQSTKATQQRPAGEEMPIAHTYALSPTVEAGVKTLTVTDAKTGKTLQILELRDCEWFTEPIYMDITFDGHKDILIPYQRPASGAFFRGYVWNPDAGQYQHVPKLEELPNIALDAERQLLLSHRTQSQITSYGMYAYDTGKQDLAEVRSLVWQPGGSGFLVTEYDMEKQVNQFSVSGKNAMNPNKPHAAMAPYFQSGSQWDLDGEKWKDTLYKE